MLPVTYCYGYISIHAPREGGDGTTVSGSGNHEISIHAPREGGDYAAMTIDVLAS